MFQFEKSHNKKTKSFVRNLSQIKTIPISSLFRGLSNVLYFAA